MNDNAEKHTLDNAWDENQLDLKDAYAELEKINKEFAIVQAKIKLLQAKAEWLTLKRKFA